MASSQIVGYRVRAVYRFANAACRRHSAGRTQSCCCLFASVVAERVPATGVIGMMVESASTRLHGAETPPIERHVFLSAMCLVLAFAAGGAALGYWLAEAGVLNYFPDGTRVPAPHLVPKYAGGTALSIAMVDDVLHERFVRHSAAYYEGRNALSRQAMQEEDRQRDPSNGVTLEYLAHMDDLAVGLDMMHRSAEAVRVMRLKHELVRDIEANWLAARDSRPIVDVATFDPSRDLTPEQQALYRTYANLGTHLIHETLAATLAGDPSAREQFAEGLQFIRRAVDVNPGAHFGRENWQVFAAEYVLAIAARPELMTKYDMFGNRWLEGEPPTSTPHRGDWTGHLQEVGDATERIRRLRAAGAADDLRRERDMIRTLFITRVGAEGDWQQVTGSSLQESAPFDEPVLGVLGMWMLGGGANPHFAVVLAGTMERVGQYEIAWRGYERAALTAERFSRDEKLRDALRQHCQARQRWLEGRLAISRKGPPPEKTGASLREEFTSEIEKALKYRQKLHAYEADQIAKGRSLADEGAFHDFYAREGRIHSAIRYADSVQVVPFGGDAWLNRAPAMLLLAGVGAMLGLALAAGRKNSR